MTLFCQILTDLQKKTFTARFLGKFAVKCILKIPSNFAYVATPPCERLMSTKQAIDDKLHGSVATYLRCSGVFNNQIKKCLLLSLRVIFLIGEYLAKLQTRTCLSRALFSSFSSVLAKRAKIWSCFKFAKYSPI